MSWSAVNLGDSVVLSDNNTFIRAITYTSSAGYADRIIPSGGILFGTSIIVRRVGLTGAASVSIDYL